MTRDAWLRVRVPGPLRAQLEARAAREGRSLSDVVRRLLERPDTAPGASRPSVFNLPAVQADPTVRADAATIRSAAARADTHPFMLGGQNGRCARADCGAAKLAGVHRG